MRNERVYQRLTLVSAEFVGSDEFIESLGQAFKVGLEPGAERALFAIELGKRESQTSAIWAVETLANEIWYGRINSMNFGAAVPVDVLRHPIDPSKHRCFSFCGSYAADHPPFNEDC